MSPAVHTRVIRNPRHSEHSVSHDRRLARLALCCTLGLTMAACGNGNQAQYANDGDTGAASPATQQTLSPNPAMGDSTSGLMGRAGHGMMAGDSGRPTLTQGDSGRNSGTNAVPREPITGESTGAAGYLKSGGQQQPRPKQP